MNPKQFKDAYEKLQALDDRLTYRVRPRANTTLARPTPEQLDERYRDLANYAIELKEVVHELFVAIAGKVE